MLDINQPYAPDLEWMLQSGQVPHEALLEALLEEYYAAIYHLALSILDDQSAAQSAAQHTFARALLEQHRYRSQDGLQFWLFRIALEACQRLQQRLQFRRSLKALLPRGSRAQDFGDSTPETLQDARLWLALDTLEAHARQVVLLHAANGWEVQRIAALFNATEGEISAVLAAASEIIAAAPALDAPAPPEPLSQLDAADLDLAGSLNRRWPPLEFSPAFLQKQAVLILRRQHGLGFRQSKTLAVLELGVLALVILLAFALIWGADTLADEQATVTPSPELPTLFVTRLVTQIVTPTPEVVILSKPTNTPIAVAYSHYTSVLPDEDLPAVAMRLQVQQDDLRLWNRLPKDADIRAGQRLLNPQFALKIKLRTATPVTPITPLPTLQEPVTIRSFSASFARKDRSRTAYWIDATQIDYGPLSYLGPPRLRRIQQWVSETQSLLLAGSYGDLPDEVIMAPNKNQRFVAQPSLDTPWFSEWRSAQASFRAAIPTADPLRDALLNPRIQERAASLQIVSRENVAGRSTIVMDLFGSDGQRASRLWVDDSLMLILHQVNYHSSNRDAPSTEYQINRLDLGVDFPQQLFDFHLPWRGGFAQDASGAPLELNAPPPAINPRQAIRSAPSAPAGFDLSHSQLTFQYSGATTDFSPEKQFEVFAGDYFLGQAFLGDPWNMICDRSPDGRWIAYASRPAQSHDPGSMLHGFDLSQPALRYFTLYNQSGISELAFSPDSQRLAFFSYPASNTPGILSILNLADQQVLPVYPTGELKSLVWSPDGKYLAFIERPNLASSLENVVAITPDGGPVYKAPLDVLNRNQQDWPMLKWGVDFPVEMGGMDACAAPPEP